MKILFVILLFTCLSAQAAPPAIQRLDGSSISVSDLDAYVDDLVEKANVAGLALAILNENRVVHIRTFGYKDSKTKEPLTPDTIFYGASFSKVIFADYVMRLVQDGKLDLDKPLVQYLSKPLYEYSFPKTTQGYQSLKDDERHKKITARMCLSHTTGFPNWRWFEDDEKLKIKFDPGTKYSYSGEGLFLLQFVIEELMHQQFQNAVQEQVFKPLAMLRSSFVWEERFENDYCVGHNNEGLTYPKKKRTAANAAGSLETTITDYATFMQAMMQRKGLKAETFAEMWKPQVRITSTQQFGPLSKVESHENDAIQLSYGLGWGLLKSTYGWAFFKEGHDDGWGHYSIGFPDNKIAFIIMTNSDHGESVFKELLDYTIKDTFTPWHWENYIPYNSPGCARGLNQVTITHLQFVE